MGKTTIWIPVMGVFAIGLIAVLMIVGTAMGEVTRTGLVGEWHFDGDAKDSSGHGNDGTIFGATFVDGKLGRALQFNGVDNYVDYGTAGIPIGKSARTIEAWVDSSTNGPQIVVGYGFLEPNQVFELGYEIGGDYRGIWVDYGWGGCVSGVYGSSGQWNHIATTFDGSDVKLYLNGNLIGLHDSRCIGANLSTQNNYKRIGVGLDNSWWFNGLIEEVRIYNRALSADEVKNNYEAGRITITSFPSGAEVLVNGVSKGIASPTLSLYGVSPGTYTVKCKLSGYSDYDTNVVLSATGVASVSCSPLPITPTPTPPVLSAYPDPPSFNFGTLNAGASGSRTFSISNTGGGTLTWSVSADQPWITINPTSGANSGTVAININTAGLSPGSYSGTIAVTSNGGTKTGSISLNIPATPPTSQPTTPIPPISQIITTIPPTSQPTTPIPPTSQPTTPIPPISQIITTIPPTSQLTTSTSPQPPSPIDKDVIISLIGALATIIAAYFGYRAYKKR